MTTLKFLQLIELESSWILEDEIPQENLNTRRVQKARLRRRRRRMNRRG